MSNIHRNIDWKTFICASIFGGYVACANQRAIDTNLTKSCIVGVATTIIAFLASKFLKSSLKRSRKKLLKKTLRGIPNSNLSKRKKAEYYLNNFHTLVNLYNNSYRQNRKRSHGFLLIQNLEVLQLEGIDSANFQREAREVLQEFSKENSEYIIKVCTIQGLPWKKYLGNSE